MSNEYFDYDEEYNVEDDEDLKEYGIKSNSTKEDRLRKFKAKEERRFKEKTKKPRRKEKPFGDDND